jgi:hypothetical protein
MNAQIIAMSSHVARTPHACTECEAGIAPGEPYVRTAIRDEEGVYALTTHAEMCTESWSSPVGW